jgi:hypothetical protein
MLFAWVLPYLGMLFHGTCFTLGGFLRDCFTLGCFFMDCFTFGLLFARTALPLACFFMKPALPWHAFYMGFTPLACLSMNCFSFGLFFA